MMKRVLLTGSAGFIGSHVVEHFLRNTNWQIIGLDSFRHRGDSLRVTEIEDPDNRYQIYTCDLTSPISYRLASLIGEVDVIINMASESHVDRSITDPVPFVQNNVNLALTMLEYARQVRPKMFIQISTDEVYGAAPDGVLHEEWSDILPSNPYSASKAAQEALAIAYWRTYQIPVVITNTMNNFGERQDPEKFVPMLINKINADQVVTIHGNTKQIGSRYYLHARNHADALKFIIEEIPPAPYEEEKMMRPPRFNVVGDTEVSNLQMAEIIANMLGKKLKYRLVDFHSARPGHDRRYALDGSLMAQNGWQPPMKFEDSLGKTIQWSLEHPEWLK